MQTLQEVKQQIEADPQHWIVPFMDFVDDFRYYQQLTAIATPLTLTNPKIDALLASTVEYLCAELELEAPQWLSTVPTLEKPWFVSGMESLKAIALVETPVWFRIRKIFVLENFLSRV